MDSELGGRVALVTGSTGRGMGRSIALTLAREGASIVLNSGTNRSAPAEAASVLEAVRAFGVEAIHVEADTSKPDQVRDMVSEAVGRLGAVDILINNAGSVWKRADLPDISEDRWRYVMASELDGVFNCVKEVVPIMRTRGWGRVVAIAMADPPDWRGMALDCTYAKACRALLMDGLAYSEDGVITFNTIKPGRIATVELQEAVELARGGECWGKRDRPTPQDVAEAVRFLCSEAGRFVTGSTLTVIGRNPDGQGMLF